MAFVDHLEATLTWTSSSATYQSKLFYFYNDATPDLENITQYADFILAKVKASLRAVIPVYVTLQPLTVRTRGGGLDIEDTSTEAGVTGLFLDGDLVEDEETDVLPEGDQIVIQRRTGQAGRSKRGRVFLPFVPEGLVDNSTLNSQGLPLYKTIATKFSQPIDCGALGILTPMTKDYKNSELLPISHCRVVSEVCTRRDRRAPKRPVAFRAPAV